MYEPRDFCTDVFSNILDNEQPLKHGLQSYRDLEEYLVWSPAKETKAQ